MKLTSKVLMEMVRKEMKEANTVPNTVKEEKVIEEGLKDKLIALADQLTDALDQLEQLMPDIFGAEREPAAHSMSDDEIIDLEKKFANEPPPMD